MLEADGDRYMDEDDDLRDEDENLSAVTGIAERLPAMPPLLPLARRPRGVLLALVLRLRPN